MPVTLLDAHVHLISDDWETYRARPVTPDLPVPDRAAFTVTAQALLAMMDAQNVAQACLGQRDHVYGYDNACILDAGEAWPERLQFAPCFVRSNE